MLQNLIIHTLYDAEHQNIQNGGALWKTECGSGSVGIRRVKAAHNIIGSVEGGMTSVISKCSPRSPRFAVPKQNTF